jgi:hypothetical protein
MVHDMLLLTEFNATATCEEKCQGLSIFVPQRAQVKGHITPLVLNLSLVGKTFLKALYIVFELCE